MTATGAAVGQKVRKLVCTETVHHNICLNLVKLTRLFKAEKQTLQVGNSHDYTQ